MTKEQLREKIKELEARRLQAADIKQRIFLEATINIYRKQAGLAAKYVF